jgi:general secretion pathway protein L
MATHVGIDIGTKSVKAAMVHASFKKLRLDALAQVNLSESVDVSEALRQVLALVTAGKPTAQDGVALAIDGDKAAVRTLTIPASAQKQISEVLRFELEAAVPFDIDGAVWDYRVLSHVKGESDKEIQVLCTIAKAEDARARIDLFRAATSIEPERIGVGAFPLANLAALPSPQLRAAGPLFVVELGTRRSEVLALVGEEVVFARTVTIGTEGLPAAAARLARELRTSIASFRSAGGDPPVKILLSGGGAFVSGAEGFLAQELGVPVEIISVPALEFGPALQREQLAAFPSYAKALGLALSLGAKPQDMNLRKGPLAFERGFAWIKEKIPALVSIGAVIALAFFLSVLVELLALAKERSTLEAALTTVTQEVLGEGTASAERVTELLQKEAALTDEDPLPHADAMDVMARISESIPQSVEHDIDELDVQKGHVRLLGVVASVSDAQEIAKSLKSERCFSDIKITRTNQMVGSTRQKYVLEFDVKCAEDQRGAGKKPANPSPSASSTSTGAGK